MSYFCFHYLLFTHLYSPEDSQALKRFMRRVRRPSSPVAISSRCCSLSEMRWQVRVLLFPSKKVWLFDNLHLLLPTAALCHTPSQSWLRRIQRDWSRSEPRHPWWWSHPPEGLNHLERGQIRKAERVNEFTLLTSTDWNKRGQLTVSPAKNPLSSTSSRCSPAFIFSIIFSFSALEMEHKQYSVDFPLA